MPCDLTPNQLLDILAHAKFENPNNWCFVNSTVCALVWSTLSVQDFSTSFWGEHCNTLPVFISKLKHQAGHISHEPWFHQVMQCWGRSETVSTDRLSQHDAAEFISSWLQVMQCPAFVMPWERRLETEGSVRTVDESTCTLPLFLQFAPIHTHLPRCALSDLFQVWHLADGMKAALLASTTCLCVHVDRCIQTSANARVSRCSTVIDTEVDCLVPMFLDQTLHCGLIEYTIIALQAHLGADAHGHYRAAVRIQPTVTQGPSPST